MPQELVTPGLGQDPAMFAVPPPQVMYVTQPTSPESFKTHVAVIGLILAVGNILWLILNLAFDTFITVVLSDDGNGVVSLFFWAISLYILLKVVVTLIAVVTSHLESRPGLFICTVYLSVCLLLECCLLVLAFLPMLFGVVSIFILFLWITVEVLLAFLIFCMAGRIRYLTHNTFQDNNTVQPEYEMVAQPPQDFMAPSCSV